MLNQEELKRYNRHIILTDFGLQKQELLKQARVLVIGAGGLGCPVLNYLAAAGVGHITIIDPDVVDLSNLQRQVLYSVSDIGLPKAQASAAKLRAMNPEISIDAIVGSFTRNNCLALVHYHDLIVDGSDNFTTRYLVNDACVIENKPFIFGSIFKFEGQVSVFNFNGGPTYRCIYPEPPEPGEVPSCSDIGVIGVLPGVIGSLQAAEAIKVITGIGEPLSGRLLMYDALNNHQSLITISKNKSIVVTTLLEDYEAFCGIQAKKNMGDEELNPKDALALTLSYNAQLVDVREDWEYEICRLDNSIHIPLKTLAQQLEKINKERPVILYCHHGIRSKNALEYLKSQGYKDVYHIAGGIDLWAEELDHNMERY